MVYYKESFEKISEEKKERIQQAAITEFAQKGFSAANINVIAKNAGISVGSIYNYFASKGDLFLFILYEVVKIFEIFYGEILLAEGDFFEKIEVLLRKVQHHARTQPELSQMYLEVTTEPLSHVSGKLSRRMESISSRFYHTLINQAKAEGVIAAETDEKIVSYCLDNLLFMLLHSYGSAYLRERMRLYAGAEALENDEQTLQGMMWFIRSALTPKTSVDDCLPSEESAQLH